MEEELISIIVPIYNVSKYLDRCMESLLKQTYTNIEIIMVDDGSPDDCGNKCDCYAKKDCRVKVIHKKNAGLGMARNSGIDISSGKYISFVDSDDYVDTKMIERLYNRLNKENADTCFCRYYNVAANGKKMLAKEVYHKSKYKNDDVKEVLLGMIGSPPMQQGDVEIGMSVWKGLYSLDIINTHNIRFPSEREYISEDIIFHIEYLKYSKNITIEETSNYYYCDNGSSLTKSYNANRFVMEKKLLEKEKMELSQIFETDEYIQRLYKAFLGRVRNCISQEVNRNPLKKDIRNNIREICEDQTVQQVLEEFNDKEVQVAKKIVNKFIKHKLITALYGFFTLKN